MWGCAGPWRCLVREMRPGIQRPCSLAGLWVCGRLQPVPSVRNSTGLGRCLVPEVRSGSGVSAHVAVRALGGALPAVPEVRHARGDFGHVVSGVRPYERRLAIASARLRV